MMHGDRAVGDTSQLQIPPELIAELQRRGATPQADIQMGDHWKPSLLSRFFALFSGKGR